MLPRDVAIIGGGRWARVLAGVALNVAPAHSRLALCSPSASEGWARWIKDLPDGERARCDPYHTMADLLHDSAISHVVIARKAKEHAETVHLALDAGKRVLVEKPFSTDLPTAQTLAERMGGDPQRAMTGLVFRYAENLRRFASACAARGDITRIDLVWGDAVAEARHGEQKTHDAGLNVAWDVFPHVWSILRLLIPNGPISVSGAGWIDDANGIVATLDIGGTRVDVTMTRRSTTRTRQVKVEGMGWKGDIDFASEPGHATIDGAALDVATGFSSPLARELSAFLGVGDGAIDAACLLPNALEALTVASDISDRVAAGQG